MGLARAAGTPRGPSVAFFVGTPDSSDPWPRAYLASALEARYRVTYLQKDDAFSYKKEVRGGRGGGGGGGGGGGSGGGRKPLRRGLDTGVCVCVLNTNKRIKAVASVCVCVTVCVVCPLGRGPISLGCCGNLGAPAEGRWGSGAGSRWVMGAVPD